MRRSTSGLAAPKPTAKAGRAARKLPLGAAAFVLRATRDAAWTRRIAGPRLEQNLNGTRSETEHAELLLADQVGRINRLRLAEIGDRISAPAHHFIGEAAAVVGLDIGRTKLDCLREICFANEQSIGILSCVERWARDSTISRPICHRDPSHQVPVAPPHLLNRIKLD